MLRLTLPRVLVALVAVLLLTYAFAVAPRTADRWGGGVGADVAATTRPSVSPPTPPREPELFPPAGKAFIGVMTHEGPYNFKAVDEFTKAAKRQPQVMLFSADWASGRFDRSLFDRISDRGMMPMLAWEPWDYRIDEKARKQGLRLREIDEIRSDQPTYRLARIASGDLDDYVLSWAEGIKSLGYPVALRFGHEMNGDWYPWSEATNGNRAGDYVKAWRHVHDLFRTAGATNVTWVWSPNVQWDESTPPLESLYPGDAYVDWLGLSGYYGTGYFSDYRNFDEIFGDTIEELRTFSERPLVITETAAADDNGRKVEWIKETFRLLPKHRDIIGVIWFEVDKELDWRIVSSRASATAFAQAVAAPRYDLRWSPEMVPRGEVDD
ncbi:glycoside hydrolase family 26 protein [Micromonospora sp. NBC_01796]|uniref:glycoside hydrolase family 26 protein n=1 Tax=Micromonospora sp. NBC_01796 TaxID=2975987 RepID=UPI002DDA4F92|nr:glycosyl hydrolase [Micromonospora sp. NBC_01796]WSA84381.1 glycosyl hydrolase [Micromonospora sp. NBC_01796]